MIRDSKGVIKFKQLLPKESGGIFEGVTWPAGEQAAKMAWEVGPMGTIELEGLYSKKVFLYGFRELWKWGIEHYNFPVIE